MFEWDESKAIKNKSKHKISLADTFAVFEDPNAVTIEDFQRRATLCHHWNGCLWPNPGSGIHMAGGKHSNNFRTQSGALRGEAI